MKPGLAIFLLKHFILFVVASHCHFGYEFWLLKLFMFSDFNWNIFSVYKCTYSWNMNMKQAISSAASMFIFQILVLNSEFAIKKPEFNGTKNHPQVHRLRIYSSTWLPKYFNHTVNEDADNPLHMIICSNDDHHIQYFLVLLCIMIWDINDFVHFAESITVILNVCLT